MSDNSRVRVAIVGVVIVALFCALLARLWFLQMGAEEALKVEAVARATRVVQTESPRGRILDRNGVVLVDNRAAWAITVDRQLDNDARDLVLGQLAEVLAPQYTVEQLAANFDDLRQSPLKPAIVAVDVDEKSRVAILEHIEDYPGTRVQKLTVRRYPNGQAAAHLLGYVGEISDEQLEAHRADGYLEGEAIGKAGAERAFESDLRGEPRRETVEVDPTGLPVGPPVDVDPGRIGNDVYLTVDANWQAAAEVALAQGIESARTIQNENVVTGYKKLEAPAGAVVAMDVTDGSVVAMASFPTYDPAQFIDGISQIEWTDLNDNLARHQPLVNRATQGVYSPGSTFKLVSSLAMTRYGVRSANEWMTDRGFVVLGADKRRYSNAGSHALGRVNLRGAITESSDVYFYTGGEEFWQIWKAGDVERGLGLQTTAAEMGFGASTGIELDEEKGTIPDPDWKQELANAIHPTEELRRENGAWYPADDILMAIGQGGMSVTPLQLANAYAAFANGGTLWQPRIQLDVRDGAATEGTSSVLRTVAPTPIRTITFDGSVRAEMLAGFEGVTESRDGTAYQAFAGFPLDQIPVAGKTGTAQVGARSEGKGDTSLFAAYFPANAPKYVVVAVVEEGGRGASVAAPIVRRVIEAITGVQPGLVGPSPVEALDGGRD
jgi:penicillin-binding protein 2